MNSEVVVKGPASAVFAVAPALDGLRRQGSPAERAQKVLAVTRTHWRVEAGGRSRARRARVGALQSAL